MHFERDVGRIGGGDEAVGMAASAMLMPPEADPVLRASTATVTASLMSGLAPLCA